jgi:DNA invertase Pin-like site-specific DNA recombinase
MTTAAYLRKSKSDDPDRELSRDVQDSAVRRMAERDGRTIDAWYIDWDRSADESKSSRRVAFAKLLRDLEAGTIDVVYAVAPDRLYRSLEAYMKLMAAAEAHGAKIIVPSGPINGDGSPATEFQAGLGALLARMELSTAKARAQDAYKVRVERKDYVGQAPYGKKLAKVDGRIVLVDDPDRPIAPIIDAFQRAGGRSRTAVRILNDELGIKSPYGRRWDRVSLRRVIERERPDLLPPRAPSGRREGGRDEPAAPVLLAKLLRCHCGRTLTPNRHVEKRAGRKPVTSVSYYCAGGNASRNGAVPHPRVYVAESIVLPFVKDELARLRPPAAIRTAEDREDERKAIADDRRKLLAGWRNGVLDDDEYAKEDAAAKAKLDALDDEGRIEFVPQSVDWDGWSPEMINASLRAIIKYVQLDEYLRPVEAVWALPDWRRP